MTTQDLIKLLQAKKSYCEKHSSGECHICDKAILIHKTLDFCISELGNMKSKEPDCPLCHGKHLIASKPVITLCPRCELLMPLSKGALRIEW